MSDAILATDLEAATPTEMVKPTLVVTVDFSSRARRTGASPEEATAPVTSRNASSSDSGSTRLVNDLKISMTCRESSR